MKAFHSIDAPLAPGDPKTFVGSVRTQRLASDEAGTPVHVYRVEFESGARTNWHIHSGPQWLFIIEGRIRVKVANGSTQDLSAGDAVVFAPGEKHWHGAVPGSRGVHLAVNVNATTDWLEPVSDQEYGR
jgi:4-carboxymuconolactone decarboxylase